MIAQWEYRAGAVKSNGDVWGKDGRKLSFWWPQLAHYRIMEMSQTARGNVCVFCVLTVCLKLEYARFRHLRTTAIACSSKKETISRRRLVRATPPTDNSTRQLVRPRPTVVAATAVVTHRGRHAWQTTVQCAHRSSPSTRESITLHRDASRSRHRMSVRTRAMLGEIE